MPRKPPAAAVTDQQREADALIAAELAADPRNGPRFDNVDAFMAALKSAPDVPDLKLGSQFRAARAQAVAEGMPTLSADEINQARRDLWRRG